MYNASDRKDIRRAEKAAKAADASRRDFIRMSMGVPSGRAWFYDLLSACHLFSVLPPTTPLVREFSEGERNVGIQIYNDILTFCPDLYLLMLHEAQVKDASNARSDPDLYDSPDLFASADEQPRGPNPNRGTDRPELTREPFDDGWDNIIGLDDNPAAGE